MTEKQIPVVFVVDDEMVISESLALILRMNGYAARSFTDSVEALEHVHADPPDILISDVIMPRLSGIDLAVQVRALLSGCKILLFSGQASTTDLLDKARKQGHVFTLLSKPIHPTALLQEIGRLHATLL